LNRITKTANMVKTNLVLTEYMAMENIALAEEKLKAVQSIKNLLSQIDFTVEVIPENNLGKFIYLLTSLKGEALNKDEVKVVIEIVNFNTSINLN